MIMPDEDKNKQEKSEILSTFSADLQRYIQERATTNHQSIDETIKEMFESSGLVVIDETVTGEGRASLKFVNLWEIQTKGGQSQTPSDPSSTYKDLRENFAPISAGIEFHKKFVITDLEAKLSEPEDPHQKEVKRIIDDLNRQVYQDDFRAGLRAILKAMFDDAATVGASAAEVVYEKSDSFTFETYATIEKVKQPKTNPHDKDVWIEVVTTIKEPSWKTDLGGIVRLKIIDDAYNRLKPIQDPKSYEILYWVLDEGKDTQARFHTWEIFWLPHDPEGTSVHGRSLIKSVISSAEALKKILDAISSNAEKLSKPRYFFVCGNEKRPWSGPNIATFLSDLKVMLEQNKTGIPVNAGFDVKSIGGEIVAAEAVINTLINIICGGMMYPREFLEGGKENEKLWLGWTVTYGDEQSEVARAVEQQLWKRHLWCKYGKEIEIAKQGVTADKRKKQPIYVPELAWKAEGRWSKLAELELLFKPFNFANPIYPETKLGLEKRIVEILAIKDVKLPTQDELEASMKAIETAMKKQGPPSPPSEEKLKKRQEEGVSTDLRPSGTTKKPNPNMGGTRIPKERQIQESLTFDTMLKGLSQEDRTELAKFLEEKRGTTHDFLRLKIKEGKLKNIRLQTEKLEEEIGAKKEKREVVKKIKESLEKGERTDR